MYIDVAVIEWPEGEAGGPRLLGRLSDPDLVKLATNRLAARRRRELAQLEGPVRLVESSEGRGE